MSPYSAEREKFLKKIGLTHDPFRFRVAEQEQRRVEPFRDEHGVALRDKTKFPLYSYFLAPHLDATSSNQTFLSALRSSQPAFIYAPHGSGKTTMRFLLEAECRTVLDHSLAVTYTLDQKRAAPETLEGHLSPLARALAIDLFVQVVEQYSSRTQAPTPEQILALGHQLSVGGHNLLRFAKAVFEQPDANSKDAVAAYLPLIHKAAVRHVPPSEKLTRLIQDAMAVNADVVPAHKHENVFQEGLRASRVWDYQRVFVLVDGVDSHNRSFREMQAWLTSLVESLAAWARRDVFFKFFLPIELEPAVNQLLSKAENPLRPPPFTAKIEWDQAGLIDLLEKRFQAASSPDLPPISFGALAGAGLEGKLYDLITRSAENSPRRMLRVVSELINTHAAFTPDHDKFNSEDWNIMRERWSYGAPPPVPLSS